MRRFAYLSLLAASVAGGIGVAILWPVARHRCDIFYHITPGGVRTSLNTHPGGITLACSNTSPDDGLDLVVNVAEPNSRFGHTHFLWSKEGSLEVVVPNNLPAFIDATAYGNDWQPPEHAAVGFGWEYKVTRFPTNVSAPAWLYRLEVPFWFVAVVTAAVTVGSWHALRRYNRRTAQGVCGRCGYDLRATPGRCPECGAASSQ